MPAESALLTQLAAADPTGSTWLTANAGSGKTRVLIDRVARLLLGGTPPARILCLTYTKAAATEMQNRLFSTLGLWAMLDDGPLREALASVGEDEAVRRADAEGLARARRLFAAAIETPGGLKIQTIHAFCAGLLRRFPLEAGVIPGFVEADERAARILRAEIVEDIAGDLAPDVFADLAVHLGAEDLDGLTRSLAEKAADLARPLTREGALALFGQPPDLDAQAVLRLAFDGSEAALMAALVPVLAAGSVNDAKAAAALSEVADRLAHPGLAEIVALEGVLLYGPKAALPHGAKTGRFPTRDTRKGLGAAAEALDRLMERIEAARKARVALRAADATAQLHAFAWIFLQTYAARKAQRGWLDFDDLIRGARRLLSDAPMAQWVLYRLDGGIDHILVDEAQDTAPGQWQVVDRLAQEMLAGEGARGQRRTIFVVGDKKQSIYSFQGADLAAFDAMQAHFRTHLADAPTPLRELTLRHSFRSAPAILAAVDATFAGVGARGTGGGVAHLAFYDTLPGRVDLWPALAPAEAPEDPDWTDPVDRPAPRSPHLVLAEQIAAEIARLIAARTFIARRDGPRAVHAGDFLVLVQRRGPLFHAIIRACKAAGIAVAGADRLRLGAEIAVRDLTALLAFLATPDDDLSLATALRSPLLGWDEDALFGLAHGRGGTLWEALLRAADTPEGAPLAAPTAATLRDLRDRADFLRPYEVLERALTRHHGRMRLIARLGTEAEDGIDQMLAQALAFERMAIPDLTGFLGWLTAGETEVRRQPDAAGQKLRVMTVHGAKGLQAPIVILPDTADPFIRDRAPVVTLAGGEVVWKMPDTCQPEAIRHQMTRRAEATAAERLRLLYVAMTRAEVWLVVAAAGKVSQPDAWHGLVELGMKAAGAGAAAFPGGMGLRLENGVWPDAAARAPLSTAPEPPVAAPALPAWALTAAPAPELAPLARRWIRPSGMGGAKIIPPTAPGPADPADALARGTLLHRLIEILADLPRKDWPAVAAPILADIPGADGLLDQIAAILDEPAIRAALFPTPPAEALAEVALTAPLGWGRVLGAVDRLIVAPEMVLAIDFKSNRDVPTTADEVPEGILRQMGAYRAALAGIWADRPVGCAVLWTATPCLMPLPEDLMRAALARAEAEATTLDADGAAS